MSTFSTWEDAVRRLLADPQQADLVRDCYFDPPIELTAQRFRNSDEWAAVREVIGAPHGRALDVGAGNGILSYALAMDGWDTSALEPDTSELVGTGSIRKLARTLGLSIKILNGMGESVPVPDGTFDLVVARQVLHHAQDIDSFCREIARVVKPGGICFFYRDHVVSGPEQLPEFFDQHPLHRFYGGENAYPEEVYRAAIERAGLSVRRIWRQFEAAFNYAPKTAQEVVFEVASRILPIRLAKVLSSIGESQLAFSIIGKILSAVDRRPGRIIAFLAYRPAK